MADAADSPSQFAETRKNGAKGRIFDFRHQNQLKLFNLFKKKNSINDLSFLNDKLRIFQTLKRKELKDQVLPEPLAHLSLNEKSLFLRLNLDAEISFLFRSEICF